MQHEIVSSSGLIPRTLRARANLPAVLLGLICATFFLGLEVGFRGALLRPSDFLLVLFFGTMLLMQSQKSWLVLPREKLFSSVYLLFSIYVAINGVFFNSFRNGVLELVQSAEFAVLYIVIISHIQTKDQLVGFLTSFFTAVSLIAAFTVAYHVFNGHIFGYKTLDEPKLLFGLVAFGGVALIVLRRNEVSFLSIAGTLVALFALLASGERKAWLAFLATLPILPIFVRRLSGQFHFVTRTWLFSAILLVAVALMILFFESSYIDKQVTGLLNSLNALSQSSSSILLLEDTISNRSRAFVTQEAVRVFQEHPIFGVGTGNFVKLVRDQYYYLPGWMLKGVHNEYLRVACENGLLGLITYIGLWLILLHRMVQVIVALLQRTTNDLILPGALVCGMLIYGAVINAFLGSSTINLFFLMVPAALFEVMFRVMVPRPSNR